MAEPEGARFPAPHNERTGVEAPSREGLLFLPDARAVTAIYQRFQRRRAQRDDLCLLLNWATLLESGVPLADSLRRLGQTTHDRLLDVGLTMFADGVERGYPLSTMIGAYPYLFPAWWEPFILVGERGSELPRVLRLLHRYLQERMALRGRFLSAFITPALAVALGLAAIGVYVCGLAPAILGYVSATGTPLLPPIRWYLMHQRQCGEGIVLALAVGLVVLLVACRWSRDTTPARRWLDHCRLRAPVFGRLVCLYEEIRVIHGLKVLTGEGASIIMGLESMAKTSSNLVSREALAKSVRQMDQGIPLVEALATVPILSPEAIQIIATGWASGQLEQMLAQYLKRLTKEMSLLGREAVSAIVHGTFVVMALFVLAVVVLSYCTIFIGVPRLIGSS